MAQIEPPLSPEQKARIRALRTAAGLDAESNLAKVSNLLNARPKVQVPGAIMPKPITWDAVLDCLTSDHVRTILALGAITTIVEKVNEQDRPALTFWVGSLRKGGFITDVEFAKLQTLMAATIEGPTVEADGLSPFQVEFGEFEYSVDGSAFKGICHPALLEASA